MLPIRGLLAQAQSTWGSLAAIPEQTSLASSGLRSPCLRGTRVPAQLPSSADIGPRLGAWSAAFASRPLSSLPSPLSSPLSSPLHVHARPSRSKAAAVADGSAAEDCIQGQSVNATLEAFEIKFTRKLQQMSADLTTFRTNFDGQVKRVSSFADRLDTIDNRTWEIQRMALEQSKQPACSDITSETIALRKCLQEMGKKQDVAGDHFKGALGQTRAEVARLRSNFEGARVFTYDRDLGNLQARVDVLTLDVGDMCRTLTRLDEQTETSIAALQTSHHGPPDVVLQATVQEADPRQQQTLASEIPAPSLQRQSQLPRKKMSDSLRREQFKVAVSATEAKAKMSDALLPLGTVDALRAEAVCPHGAAQTDWASIVDDLDPCRTRASSMSLSLDIDLCDVEGPLEADACDYVEAARSAAV